MRAMPSPTCSTVPTSARSVSTSYCSICRRRIEVISSGRSFTRQLLRRVHDGAGRLDAAAGGLLDALDDRPGLILRELVRRRQLDAQHLLLGVHERLQLA